MLHRVALDRVLPMLGDRAVDSLTGDDVALLIETLSASGRKRETIRKSVKYLAAVLDFAGVEPNPARDKQRVRLPYEELEEMNPPTAAHVEAVYRLLVPAYRLPLLVARLVRRARRLGRHAPGRRLRRARPPRPAAGVHDEDSAGAVGGAARRAG